MRLGESMKTSKVFKIANIFCVGLLACLFSIILTACGEHQHSFSDWVETTAATCTTDGLKTRTCSGCGEVETEVIPALGHNWVEDSITHAATCEEDGKEITHCSRCNEHDHEITIPALGHLWSEEVYGTGMEHYHICEREIDLGNESALEYVRSTHLSCTEDEAQYFRCPVCGYDECKILIEAATGHDYVDCDYVEKSATTHARICNTCGEEDVAEPCTFTKNQITVASTCETDGYNQADCEHCNNQQKSNIQPATQHTYSQPTHIIKLVDGVEKHYHVKECSKPDCVHEEHYRIEEECVFETETVNPTCDYDDESNILNGRGYDRHTCSVCQYFYDDNYVDSLEHTWSSWEHSLDGGVDVHKRSCSVCHRPQQENCEVNETEHSATCDRNAYTHRKCYTCDLDEEIEKAQTKREHQLVYEQLKTGDESDHEFHIEKCAYDDCDYERQVEHELSSSTHEQATCTTPEYVKKSCSKCGHEHIDQNGEPLGHEFIEWTYKDESYHTSTCNRADCDLVAEEEHDCTDSNTCAKCGHDDLVYEEVGGVYYVKKLGKYSVNSKNIVIPAQHEGKDVVGIAFNAFTPWPNEAKMETFTATSENFVSIGDYAFSTQEKLKQVNLPSSVKTIGTYAFYNCASLTDIKLPTSVSSIGDNAFMRTGIYNNWERSGKDDLYIELTTGDVTKYYFVRLRTSFTSEEPYIVKDKTFAIANGAFKDCTNLKNLILPKELKYVGADAFVNCTGLESDGHYVEFRGGVKDWLSIKFANEDSSPIKHANIFHLEIQFEDQQLDLTGTNITQIPAGTFRDDYDHDGGYKLKSVIIPDTVTFIGANAFNGCKELKTITINSTNITYIGENAFLNTAAYTAWKEAATAPAWYLGANKEYLIAVNEDLITLTEDKTYTEVQVSGEFKLDDNVKVIADEVFKDFTALTKIEIGDNSALVAIGDYAFYGCKNLTYIRITKNVQYIGTRAFTGCGLKTADFDVKINWLADTTHGKGMSPKLETPEKSAYRLTTEYQGTWTRNWKF